MKTLLDNELRFHHSAFKFQAYRQELLASNIANADTPHYKARDVDFRAALDHALGGSASGGASLMLQTTHHSHLGSGLGLGVEQFTGFRGELQSAVDGNTVNMDVERAAFAENALRYEASLTFINGMFRQMGMALTGQ